MSTTDGLRSVLIKPKFDRIKPFPVEIKPSIETIKPRVDADKPSFDAINREPVLLPSPAVRIKPSVVRHNLAKSDHRLGGPQPMRRKEPRFFGAGGRVPSRDGKD